MSATPVIATSGLSKDYGCGRGLFELDLEVRQGEVFGFLGPNGAGKSTAMRLLLDLIKPTSGSAHVFGLDVGKESLAIRRRVGFLPGDQLACFGVATGALALAVAAGTGRRSLATGIAAAVGILGWLINGFAPLVSALAWSKYLSVFFYYAGHDPLTQGVDIAGIVLLIGVTLLLTVLAMTGIERRDLRA